MKWFIPACLVCLVGCLTPSILVDMHYYRNISIPFVNILKYNVKAGGGSELYGVRNPGPGPNPNPNLNPNPNPNPNP